MIVAFIIVFVLIGIWGINFYKNTGKIEKLLSHEICDQRVLINYANPPSSQSTNQEMEITIGLYESVYSKLLDYGLTESDLARFMKIRIISDLIVARMAIKLNKKCGNDKVDSVLIGQYIHDMCFWASKDWNRVKQMLQNRSGK